VVGAGQPCYVIAEAGVNHNGDIGLASALVLAARAAGADCVKFQTFRADRVATTAAPKADYQLRQTDPGESQIDMLRRLELTAADFAALVEECRRAGIDFLSTPYSPEDVELLESIGAPAYKIASALLVEPMLLERVARTGKPVFLSTGMATMAEVEEAVSVLRRGGDPPLVLLQCTTDYPSDLAEVNLRAMTAMAARFGVPVGYSDHTTSVVACLGAVALGAAVVEKHFTLDRTLPGPDHATSVDPAGLAALVASIRDMETALGSPEKRPTPREQVNAVGMRRSLVAQMDIPAGTVIADRHLACKRPATGIPPREAARVVGRTARVAIAADELIEWGMLD